MNKKILVSLATMGVAAALVISGTIAFFSDTETSTGNTLTAGALDLKVDSECHYNGMVCGEDGKWHAIPGMVQAGYPEEGTDCNCTWLSQDLEGEAFFSFTDVKPGDWGEDTLSFHVDNNAWACMVVDNFTDSDNGCTEPESKAEPSCTQDGDGELDEHLLLTAWVDYDCENDYDDGEDEIIVEDNLLSQYTSSLESVMVMPIADNSPESAMGQGNYIPANDENQTDWCVAVSWNVPGPSTGNEVQTDSLGADLMFYVEQARNNPNFTCDGWYQSAE